MGHCIRKGIREGHHIRKPRRIRKHTLYDYNYNYTYENMEEE